MVRQNNKCIYPSSTYSVFCQIWNHFESKNFGYTLTHTHTKQILYTNRAEVQSFLLPHTLLSININVLCGLNNSQRDNRSQWSVLRLKDPSHPTQKNRNLFLSMKNQTLSSLVLSSCPFCISRPAVHIYHSPMTAAAHWGTDSTRDKRATNIFSKHGN